MKNKKNFLWTKQSIKTVIGLWEDQTKEEIAEQLGCNPFQVSYIASKIRRAGYDLPRKSRKGYLDTLIKEVIGKK